MSKIIKTQIDGIDVELELTNFGEESSTIVTTGEINTQEKPAPQIKVIKVGNGDGASEEDTKKVTDKVNSHSAELIASLINAISQIPASGKPWWQSRILWVNIIAILSSVTAYFGFSLNFLTPEMCMTLVPIIMGALNIYLRLRAKDPIQPINVPPAIDKLR